MAREQFTSIPGIDVTSSSTSKEHDLGTVAWDNAGNAFRYVQNNTADGIAIADGTCVYPTASEGVVSPDYTGGNGVGALVVGVGVGDIPAGSYGWIQVSGYHDAVNTDGGVVAGDKLIGHTVDGQADTMAAGEEHLVFGVALTDDTAGNTVPAQIFCL